MDYISTKLSVPVILRKSADDFEPITILDAFRDTVKKYPNRIALVHHNKRTTWEQYYDQCLVVANGFLKLGLKKYEGVAILGFNSPEWFISNIAAIMAGGVSVGIYATNSAGTCQYIINDSNSTIVVVEDAEQMNKLFKFIDQTNIRCVIQYSGTLDDAIYTNFDLPVYDWHSFFHLCNSIEFERPPPNRFSNHKKTGHNELCYIFSRIKPNQCSSLIYTSGTTGNPKGVMLSHDNIMWTTRVVLETMNLIDDVRERIVSYLPLSHVAAQMVDLYMPLVNGATTWFATSDALKGSLVDTLKVAKPTIFLGVPRVWEKIMEKMITIGKHNSILKQKIAADAKKIGLSTYYSNAHKKSFKWNVYNNLIYKKVKQALGLSHCKIFLTGAAPISLSVLEYFASLNIPIYEIYGMSECSGPMTLSYKNNCCLGTCGKPLGYTEVQLTIFGEICTNGRNVMMGYLNQPKKTYETINKDGWLFSGDIGRIDSGYLTVTGRIKEILITKGGENIPPVPIEERVISQLPIISNCMLIGDKRKYLTILLTLKVVLDTNGDLTDQLDNTDIYYSFDSKVTTVDDAIHDNKVNDYIWKGLQQVNLLSSSRAQRIQKFTILPIDFSISGGELGPTLKLKRNVVIDKYNSLIDNMYE